MTSNLLPSAEVARRLSIKTQTLAACACRISTRVGRSAGAGDAMTEQVIGAPALAERLGLKTGTLAKWRYLGKGPHGWKYQSKTRVVYPLAEVERYEAEMNAERTTFSPPPPRGCQHPAAKRPSFVKEGAVHATCSFCGKTLEPTMTSQEALAK
jgi:hypothetical protein